MRLGLDIASLAEQGKVNQIVMISGDSDFVPAAKHARRSGIDFILDPMWSPITDSLSEHIDGIRECVRNPPMNKTDPLHVNNLGMDNAEAEDEEEL
ncbi:NYN domain protein [Corynebacterium simulans]|uniref:NYN domain protein n=2 Tax=Corynebacteriaceae TaxID=1653 RepID=A0ABR5V8N5_9CORY|nr:NYN domain protein [Corynebacterium simulans]